jgi:macrolide phosphotransferase
MARSPLTLAAAATAALSGTGNEDVAFVGAATLTEHAAGRYDSALLKAADDRRFVVRVPLSADAESDLALEERALAALTNGVRSVLGFRAPDLLGRSRLGGHVARVFAYLDGYRVDAAHVPAGRGVATSLAAAIAAVHDLPASVVQAAGLPVSTAAQVQGDTERLLDRAEATGRLPFGLLRRWSRAVAVDALWRFEPTVTLGGADPASFLLVDVDDVPTVSALLTWAGLRVGDPAEDLRWISSAPDAANDVVAAYAASANRSPDAMLAERARLHAELEFAKWLVHGHEIGSDSIMDDAVALLASLDESVRDEPAIGAGTVTVDDAIAALGRVPDARDAAIDTSMQTDAYDPGSMDLFDDEDETPAGDETQPLEFTEWPAQDDAEWSKPADADADDDRDPDDAARNALRRWTGTA